MAESTNLKLHLTDADDTSMLVADWVQKISGNNSGSNMFKIDSAIGDLLKALAQKQNKLNGQKGQIVGFDENGNPEPQAIEASYDRQVATSESLGGVRPVAKTETMTYPVGVDATGGLWCAATDVDVDETLSKSGAAADAQVVGEAFAQAEQVLSQLYAAVNRPKVSAVGLSSWDDGSVLVQDANGEVYTWDIDFDSEGRPVKFTSTDDNHEVTVTWEGSGDGA